MSVVDGRNERGVWPQAWRMACVNSSRIPLVDKFKNHDPPPPSFLIIYIFFINNFLDPTDNSNLLCLFKGIVKKFL